MKKRIAAAFVLLFALLLSTAAAAYDAAYIRDGADLLTDAEEAALAAHFDGIYADSGLLCVFVTANGSENVLQKLPDYADGAVDMLLLYVDMDARDFDLYQYNGEVGEAAFRVNSKESDAILDGVLDYAKAGDWYGAAVCFADESEAAFLNDVGFVPGTDKYGDEGYTEYTPPAARPPVNPFALFGESLGRALPFGLIAALIAVICVVVSYKKKVRGETYPLDAYTNLNLTDSQDNFLNKNLVVTVIRQDPPASSGGHSGGFSGGGGGGGHMGGRSF